MVAFFCIGWVINLYYLYLAFSANTEIQSIVYIQIMGVLVFPVGGLLGWFLIL